jgi:methyltransferase (TIGR00027 family)
MNPDRPSSTALLIAASTVFLRLDAPEATLVSREAADYCAQFLRAAGPPAARVLDLVGRGWFRRAVRMLESITIPGIQVHYALRKRYVRDWVLHNIREGYPQIVVLGAGLDTLCLELHARLPEACFIEVDHPATQRVKLQALAAMGVSPRNVFLVPADLSSTTLDEALAACPGYAPTRKTLFVAEGLFMYLEADCVNDLLDYVTRWGQNRIAFTFLEPRRDGTPNFRIPSRLVDKWLNLRSECFRWGVRRTELGSYLSSRGLRLAQLTDDETFARCFPSSAFPGGAPAVGEYICMAAAKP